MAILREGQDIPLLIGSSECFTQLSGDFDMTVKERICGKIGRILSIN